MFWMKIIFVGKKSLCRLWSVDTPLQLEEALSTELLPVHRNVSWIQVPLIRSSEPHLPSTENRRKDVNLKDRGVRTESEIK